MGKRNMYRSDLTRTRPELQMSEEQKEEQFEFVVKMAVIVQRPDERM